jgi:hypothetical protein
MTRSERQKGYSLFYTFHRISKLYRLKIFLSLFYFIFNSDFQLPILNLKAANAANQRIGESLLALMAASLLQLDLGIITFYT